MELRYEQAYTALPSVFSPRRSFSVILFFPLIIFFTAHQVLGCIFGRTFSLQFFASETDPSFFFLRIKEKIYRPPTSNPTRGRPPPVLGWKRVTLCLDLQLLKNASASSQVFETSRVSNVQVFQNFKSFKTSSERIDLQRHGYSR